MKKITILICSLFLISFNILFAQHLKKDGTPDRRYKENKSNYSTSPSSYSASSSISDYNYNSTNHLKKDGTPDKRYKENKTVSFSDKTNSTPAPKFSTNLKYSFVPRDSKGRIKRSYVAIYEFKKETGYPHGRPGYVIDHVIPLKRGGCDCPSNMQWQTKAEAKAKDKIE
jgi:hypothetical protein